MRALLALAATTLILCACGAPKKAGQQEPFEDVVWQLDGESTSQPVTLEFDRSQKRVSGFSGCNRFAGSYTLAMNQIYFGPTAGTMMACADAAKNTNEQNFLSELSKTDSYYYDGGALVLYDARAKEILRFHATSPSGAR